MKIKANKAKLVAAITARLKEKKDNFKKELAAWEAVREQRKAELISKLSENIAQLKSGKLDPDSVWKDYPRSFYGYPSISYGDFFSLGSHSPKPSEPSDREEKRLLAQLDIIDATTIEIDDHSDYFRYI